jgi:single-strand DNA-binding protein
MAGSVNKVILVGNVGKDPEIRRTQDGRPIANLSIATSETWRDKNSGERKEKTEWHRVVIFSEPLCKVVEQYVKKGAKLYIEGALQTRKWTDQAGVEKYSTEVVLQGFNGQLTMLDSKGGGAGAGSGMGMQDSGGGDYAAEGGYSGGGGSGYGSGSGASSGSYGGSKSNGASGGAAGGSKTGGGAAKPFNKQLDDEIPF